MHGDGRVMLSWCVLHFVFTYSSYRTKKRTILTFLRSTWNLTKKRPGNSKKKGVFGKSEHVGNSRHFKAGLTFAWKGPWTAAEKNPPLGNCLNSYGVLSTARRFEIYSRSVPDQNCKDFFKFFVHPVLFDNLLEWTHLRRQN